MEKKYTHYIGIDPDVAKSGVAVLNKQTRNIELFSLTLPELMAKLIKLKSEGINAVVIVEAGWLNKGNWHIRFHDNRGQAAMKGYQVGRNHEAGKKIIEVATFFGYPIQEQKPLRKCWQGADRKITAEELALFTGYNKRSTQDARDAALLAWNAANLPIFMNTNNKKFEHLKK